MYITTELALLHISCPVLHCLVGIPCTVDFSHQRDRVVDEVVHKENTGTTTLWTYHRWYFNGQGAHQIAKFP